MQLAWRRRRRDALAGFAMLAGGCFSSEPLAPPFAGNWAPADMSQACGRLAVRIGRDGIGVKGGYFPFGATLLGLEKASLRGATVDLVLRPRDPTRGLLTTVAGRRIEIPRVDVLVTLRAQGDLVYASNVLFRDHDTGRLRLAPRDADEFLRMLTLRRCA